MGRAEITHAWALLFLWYCSPTEPPPHVIPLPTEAQCVRVLESLKSDPLIYGETVPRRECRPIEATRSSGACHYEGWSGM